MGCSGCNMDQCFLLGLELPGGACAQWFSGSASTAAVIVAVGANLYAAWRQKNSDRASDAIEVAGVSMQLRAALRETCANAKMFHATCRSIDYEGQSFTISRPLASAEADKISLLSNKQADVLIRSDLGEFAENLDRHLGNINLLCIGVANYAKLRSEARSEIGLISTVNAKLSDEQKEKVENLSHIANYFLNRTTKLLSETIAIICNFNSFCLKNDKIKTYMINFEAESDLLKSLDMADGDGETE